MSQDWYYSIDTTQQGPVSAGELRKLALNGTLKPTDLVWKDGMAEWTPAKAIKGLFAAPPSASPKPATEASVPESSPSPTPAAPSEPPLPDLPPVPQESAKPKPKKSGSLRDRLDNVQDKGRKKADDEVVEVSDDDIIEDEAPPPKRSRKRSEDEDDEDRPQKRRRGDDEEDRPRPRRKPSRGPSEMPSGIRTTGIIWMAIGAINMLMVLGAIGYVLINKGDGPIPAEGLAILLFCAGCMAIIPALFLFTGFVTYKGSISPVILLLVSVLSILFGVMCLGSGVFYFTNGGAVAEAVGPLTGISNFLFGIGFIAAGVLAFMNKAEYEQWKDGDRPNRSRKEASRYYDEDEDFDDYGPRRRKRR